jgi:large exoprotein involved in heme utilization and adhesion
VINGTINANGQVILVNSNGVIFGKGAEVNVGGMVATTMNTSAEEFMNAKSTQTYKGGANGKIINRGRINVMSPDGYVALMAPEVINEGVVLTGRWPTGHIDV